jgi:hypothetical protein
MRRLLAFVLALVLPLQSAVALENSLHLASARGCQMTYSTGHAADAYASAGCHCSAGGGTAGHHGGAGHHPCAHMGVALFALPCAGIPITDARNVAPSAGPAAFDSVVLGVPSPPPTVA